jgi:hypothetical protein
MFYGTRECKNMSSYKQENYCNAELLCEEVNDIFTEGIKETVKN